MAGGSVRQRKLAIVIAGAIASGKSTLAVAVASGLEEEGLHAGTIDLDLVYETLAPGAQKDDPDIWTRARTVAAGLANEMFDDGFDVVVAEGDFLQERERQELADELRSSVRILYVTLMVALDRALERVVNDPTRGRSKDPVFLARHYDELAESLRTRPESDLCLDTGELTVDEAAAAVVRWSRADG